MTKKIAAMLVSASLVLCQVPYAFADTHADANAKDDTFTQETAEELLSAGEYAEGELLVVFDDNVSDSKIEKIVESGQNECVDIIDMEEHKAAQVDIGSDADMSAAMETLMDNPKVEYVQPNYRYSFQETDKYLAQSNKRYHYQFEACSIFDAWDELYKIENRKKIYVAVMDTGVDVSHEDLKETLKYKNSYVRTTRGVRKDASADTGEHGTHVCGIIGATYGNGTGSSGVASGYNNDLIELIAVGVSDDGEYVYTRDVVEGVKYCIEEKADVINMSFGAEGKDMLMGMALKDAYDNGIVVVAASGNDGISGFNSPASFKEVIAVNATNILNQPTYWSNFGTWTDVSAPGNSIMSTKPGNRYQFMSGTSMASPVAAGIVALVRAANPELTPAQINNIICATAVKTASEEFDEDTGYGIINAKAAVVAARQASVDVDVESLFIKDAYVKLDQYENYSLETLVRPAESLKAVTWTSDNEAVASVDENGNVICNAPGKCRITAFAGDKTAECTVVVKGAVKPTSIAIKNKTEIEKMVVGQTIAAKAKILPGNATNTNYYFVSSNPSVASVDDEGILEAFACGTCTLTVKSETGNVSDSVTINVKDPAEKVKITKSIATAKVGEEHTFAADLIVEGNKPTNDVVYWYSTNTDVATVDKLTGKVKAKHAGVTYIKACTSSTADTIPSVSASKKLTVGKKSYTASNLGLKKAKVTYNTIAIKWKKIPIATKYYIYRADKKNGSYKKLATVKQAKTLNYSDTGLTSGHTYYYKVKAVYRDGSILGTSSEVAVKAKPAAPANVKLEASKGKNTVSWSKVKGATGYKVYRADSKTGKYEMIAITKLLSYADQDITKGKKYFYKVCAYRKAGGKETEGQFSAVLSVKSK